MRPAAVERGTDATRLVVPGPDGRPERVAVLPAGTPVATALAQLVGPPGAPIVVVQPRGGAVHRGPGTGPAGSGPVPDDASPGTVPVGSPLRTVASDGSAVVEVGSVVGIGPGGPAAGGAGSGGPALDALRGVGPDAARHVRSVPAPVAVLAGRAGRFLVVDAGRSGTTLTVVDGGCVRSTVRLPVGGDGLDALLGAATGCPAGSVRRAREALSFTDLVEVPGHGPLELATVTAVLRPAFDDVVARVPSLAAGVEEIVLAGGLARTPLLAEMLDERVEVPVRVLPEPDLAAVRGALRWLDAPPGPGTSVVVPGADAASDGVGPGPGDHRLWSQAFGSRTRHSRTADHGVGPVDPASTPAASPPAASPPAASPPAASPPAARPGATSDGARGDVREAGAGPRAVIGRRARPTRARRGLVLPGVAAVGVLLVGAGTVLGATGGRPAPPSGTLVQYGYAVALPAGWEHTGGNPGHRRTLLTRAASPDGVELVSVERSPLGYDSAAEPDRARAELAAAHAATPGLGRLGVDTVAGRPVTRYRQQAGPDAVVDWFVLFDGTDELVVGCRRPARGPVPEIDRACAEIVGSVRTVDGPG